MKKIYVLFVLLSIITIAVGCHANNNGKVVNLYTTRHYDADDALYQKFTEETGIIVNVVNDESQVSIEKIKSQGDSPVADLFMTADAGNLASAKAAGILQPISSDILENNIPAKYQDIDNHWFGLTKRARVFLYANERVNEADLASLNYDTLVTDERWTNQVLVRSSSNIYNQSLVSAMIAMYGEAYTQAWTDNLVSQMARNPEGNDRQQAVAVRDGIGDIAIANSYYYGQLVNETDTSSSYYGVAEKVGIFFPGQGDDEDGVHINISGAGVVKNAKNKENAIKLLEFLSAIEQQEIFSATNYEFPVNASATPSALLTGWLSQQGITTLREFDIDLSLLGVHNEKALNIMITAKWDTPKQS